MLVLYTSCIYILVEGSSCMYYTANKIKFSASYLVQEMSHFDHILVGRKFHIFLYNLLYQGRPPFPVDFPV